jgi:hypothetical protein
MGFRTPRGTDPYDVEAMETAARRSTDARIAAWGDGAAGRARTAFPLLNYDEAVDWDTYYMLHPNAGSVYAWRQQ